MIFPVHLLLFIRVGFDLCFCVCGLVVAVYWRAFGLFGGFRISSLRFVCLF